ncbi:MAG: adenylyl-sulfate kinase, partial [Pseudomonadota bacterium]|nr:adenylyl-sulfate kinase [Pseudomonadota bacterium]
LTFIPISALNGDNVVNPSMQTPWYDGPTLMALLENVKISTSRNFDDFRFPVQYVNRPNLNFRGYCGTVASGVVRKGDRITVLPSGKSSTVKSIVTFDEELELASPQMAVTLTLEDEIDISRGDLIVHDDNLPGALDTVTATIVWMSEDTMLPGKQYDFKHATKALTGQISTIRHKIDVNTLEQRPAPVLELNEIALCEVSFTQKLFFDPYKRNITTGAFIIIDRLTNVTVGAGMIENTTKVSRHREGMSGHVTPAERQARFGQKPVTVMFVGLSGSGKSTLAHALERRLFDMGRVSSVLDGKTMRLGISKDLPHDAAGRAENLRRSAYIARYVNDSGLICCAAFTAASAEARNHTINVIGEENCIVVYLNPPLDICQQRDPSGLYAAEANQPSGNVPGISFPYEAPEAPDLLLPTHELDVDECIDRVLNLMRERELI